MAHQTKTFMQHLFELRHKGLIERDLTTLLHAVTTSCKAIANHLKNGDLGDAMGSLDSQNVQGETQKKLDVIANDIFLERCQYSGVLCAMVSEEMDQIYPIPGDFPTGPYVLFFDPLDGSSNVDVNVSVGTIFSIFKLSEIPDKLTVEALMKPGVEQVAAGYALYGPSTMLVLTTGHGVDAFTFDGSIGEFRQTHVGIQIPEDTSEIAINASRARYWEAYLKTYVDECFEGANGPRGRDFNMRWVASMVAEVHRILLRGGVFMYPVDSQNRKAGGKLRLLYEANPMSFLVEQAGGRSVSRTDRIMEIAPENLHQRVGVFMGSKSEVDLLVSKAQASRSVS